MPESVNPQHGERCVARNKLNSPLSTMSQFWSKQHFSAILLHVRTQKSGRLLSIQYFATISTGARFIWTSLKVQISLRCNKRKRSYSALNDVTVFEIGTFDRKYFLHITKINPEFLKIIRERSIDLIVFYEIKI